MKKTMLFAAFAAGMIGAGQAGAQDIAAGEKIYKGVCRACHGPSAQGMASFPKLADKETDYIVMRLGQYRAGETVGPNTPLMKPHAARLSDEDIANIAAYITTAFE